jgi:hypothetical protein
MALNARLALLPFLVIALTGCSSGPSMPDAAIKELLERNWTSMSDIPFQLGEVHFVAEDRPQKVKQAAIRDYPLYIAYRDAGVLEIAGDRDLTRDFTGWNDFLSLSQNGVRRVATIKVTAKGRRIAQIVNDQVVLLRPPVKYQVDTVVSNEALRIGADPYRIAIGLFTRTMDSTDNVAKAWMAIYGDSFGDKRRFRVLLKFDIIAKSWGVSALDVGAASYDFPTDNVGKRVASLKQGTE